MERGPAAKAVTDLQKGVQIEVLLRRSPMARALPSDPLAPVRSTEGPAGWVIPAT